MRTTGAFVNFYIREPKLKKFSEISVWLPCVKFWVSLTNPRAAAMARRKMIPGKIMMWGINVAVDWAEPEPDVEISIMSKALITCMQHEFAHEFLFLHIMFVIT